MISMNPKGKKSITALITEELYLKIKLSKKKAVIWKELDKLFGAMGKKYTQKQLDQFRKDYPLAYQFVEEIIGD